MKSSSDVQFLPVSSLFLLKFFLCSLCPYSNSPCVLFVLIPILLVLSLFLFQFSLCSVCSYSNSPCVLFVLIPILLVFCLFLFQFSLCSLCSYSNSPVCPFLHNSVSIFSIPPSKFSFQFYPNI